RSGYRLAHQGKSCEEQSSGSLPRGGVRHLVWRRHLPRRRSARSGRESRSCGKIWRLVQLQRRAYWTRPGKRAPVPEGKQGDSGEARDRGPERARAYSSYSNGPTCYCTDAKPATGQSPHDHAERRRSSCGEGPRGAKIGASAGFTNRIGLCAAPAVWCEQPLQGRARLGIQTDRSKKSSELQLFQVSAEFISEILTL